VGNVYTFQKWYFQYYIYLDFSPSGLKVSFTLKNLFLEKYLREIEYMFQMNIIDLYFCFYIYGFFSV